MGSKGAVLGSFTGTHAIDCQDLWFSFTEGGESALNGTTLQLPRGARCLLVGANGGASFIPWHPCEQLAHPDSVTEQSGPSTSRARACGVKRDTDYTEAGAMNRWRKKVGEGGKGRKERKEKARRRTRR
jgi:CCR4-NOT complex subunit CAF16